ncbi:MAG: sulfoxide reductase heme-binding subunit YedZ [Pelagibacteraceae bacterium]|nr:sulfoxide reductase heme-binding subunit YedZ [Pelagibacteraceae bacterium]
MILTTSHVKKIKKITFIFILFPSFYWSINFYLGNMGVNPVDAIIREFGEFSLILIIVTLSITPISKIKSLKNFQILRRMLGLFSFYYVCLHLISYVFLDHFFNWEYILKDIYKRPFITLGFLSFVLLIPLAITSNNKAVRKLKYKVWKNIHRIIYPVSILGGFHYFLLTKSDKTEPLIYLIIIFFLLIFRIVYFFSKKLSSPK